jgi:hypothetical protein
MHLRPYRNQDANAIAAIKARCDLADPLVLFYRRTSSPDTQQKDDDKRWRAHVKSTRRSLCLEILMPGNVCWVLVLDDEDVEATNNHQNQQDKKQKHSSRTTNDETVVGFTIWSRYGSSDMARRWQGHGEKLATRNSLSLAFLFNFLD